MEALRLEQVMVDLALRAGRAIMEVYDAGPVDVHAKADQSPVTAADLAADEIIRTGLADAFPDIPAVTEEAAESHALSGSDRFFLVDPLDGTKEFIHRRGDFTVNIALIEGGTPVAGCVYAPARGRLFVTGASGPVEWAVEGFALAGQPKPLKVAEPDNCALRVVASKSHRDKATDDLIAKYQVAAFKSAGSSLKFCLVAAGEADFYPRLGRTMEWDTAAGHAVLAAAGGVVLRFEDQTPLRYGKPGWDNPFFLAMAPAVAV